MDTALSGQGVLESRDDFKKNPRGQFDFWDEELKASKSARKKWHRQSDGIVKRFLDARGSEGVSKATLTQGFRLNLFHSNIVTLMSMLYGQLPKIDVSRRFNDANDDIGRTAAEMMERLLNNDVEDNGEEYNSVLRSTLQDRLLCGLGCARVRYEVETEGEGDEERMISERAPCDYFYWGDVLWSWGRNWSELNWLAYRVWLTKDEATEMFGSEAADEMQYKKQLVSDTNDREDDPNLSNVWMKTAVWEVWDKVEKKVIWLNLEGPKKVLKTADDPLNLNGFFPSPPFFIANVTTQLYHPTPDFHLSQDLYNEVDRLQTRIAIITEAVKVIGLYDSSNAEVQRMFKEGVDNTLIPVENWAMFGEKGGMAGAVDWFPLQDVVGALDKLRSLRDETIQLLFQVTGMNETMRGGSQGQYEGSGQVQMQAKMGSVRVQALQDEFARFASDLLQIKAEVIAKHFSPETIVKMSNMENSFDVKMIEPAVRLIKEPDKARLRIAIRPESVSMVDYAQLKAERTDYINALAVFMQSSAPLIQQEPDSMPFLMELLQWGLAGFKGSQEIEGVLDGAITIAKEKAQEAANAPPEQSPEEKASQAATQAAMGLEQLKQQGELSKIQAKAAADRSEREFDMEADIKTAQALSRAKVSEIMMDLQATVAEIKAKLEADMALEQAQATSNIAQTAATVKGEIQKDEAELEFDMTKDVAKTSLKIDEITTAAQAKIAEQAEGKDDATS